MKLKILAGTSLALTAVVVAVVPASTQSWLLGHEGFFPGGAYASGDNFNSAYGYVPAATRPLARHHVARHHYAARHRYAARHHYARHYAARYRYAARYPYARFSGAYGAYYGSNGGYGNYGPSPFFGAYGAYGLSPFFGAYGAVGGGSPNYGPYTPNMPQLRFGPSFDFQGGGGNKG